MSELCSDDLLNINDNPDYNVIASVGPFPVPEGFVRVGIFNTNFVFWDKFETNYVSGTNGPSMRFDNETMTARDMLVGFEFKIGPRHGVRGDDMIDIKFPRCNQPGGERGNYIVHIEWHTDGSNSEGGVGSEWPHPVTASYDFNTDDPNPTIGNVLDGQWHGFLAACYNNSKGNVVLKSWYNQNATNNISDYVYLGSSIDVSGQIAPAPKLPFASYGYTGNGTHPLQIRIDEIPSNDLAGGPYKYPSTNFNIQNMFACEIREGALPTTSLRFIQCPAGQHYDALQNKCVLDSGSKATTTHGIIIPSLPYDSYTLDPINYDVQSVHKANGSFRENFLRQTQDLNSVVIGGYVKCDGPDDEEISAKLGGGVHSPSDGGKAGRCYEINIPLEGNSINVLKEDPHGVYHETFVSNALNIGTRQGHYTGVIFMKTNVKWNGNECVRLQAWIDVQGMNDAGVFTSAKQNWVQVLDAIDSGKWYDKAWLTGATPGNSIATIRVDQQLTEEDYDFKFGFCARINGGPASY